MKNATLRETGRARTPSAPELGRRSGAGHWAKLVLGYALAVGGLLWVLHDFHFAELRAQLSQLRWGYVALALGCCVLGYLCQGLRWKLLLQSFGKITVLQSTEALCAGMFVSEVTPLSLGELARAYLASRRMRVHFASVLPTVLIERLFDGLWMAIGIGLMAIFLPLPRRLLVAADALGAAVLTGAATLIYFLLRRPYHPEFTPKKDATKGGAGRRLKNFLRAFWRRLAEGLYTIGLGRNFYLSFAASLLYLAAQSLTFWLMLRGYGLKLSIWSAAATVIIILMGTALPGPPGNLGTYQFACVLGLTLFGVGKPMATGFSLVVYAVLSAPLYALGLLALSRSGVTLSQLRREAHEGAGG
jgi:uncharacterized protein (TIRG00374 family)